MKHFGPKEFWIRLTERFQADDVDYEEWYKNHKPTMEELQRQDNRIKDVNDYLIFTSSKEQTQNIQSGRKLSNR